MNTAFSFKDMQKLLSEAWDAALGIGDGRGKNAVESATRLAITSPLLGNALEKTRVVLVYFTGSEEIGAAKLDLARAIVSEAVDASTEIHCATAIDVSLEDTARVTVFAFIPNEEKRAAVRQAEIEATKHERRRQEKRRVRNSLRFLRRYGEKSFYTPEE